MSMNVGQRQVTDHGQISKMRVPAGWVEAEVTRRPFDLWTMKTFHPHDRPQIRLCLYYRGHPVSARSAESFRRLLEQDPQELTEKQWWEIQEVLRDAAIPEAFEKSSASVANWNGKPVVVFEGRWPQSQEDSLGILVNADGTGSQIQEIFFVAPVEEFKRYLQVARAAIEAIEWK